MCRLQSEFHVQLEHIRAVNPPVQAPLKYGFALVAIFFRFFARSYMHY